MNALTLAVASIKSRPLHSSLCTTAVAAGIALLCAVFLFSQSVAAGFARNAQGIDIVVGTKGSPLQMVLSSVYHADIPAGNITMADYEELKRSRQVRQAIPLALGDSYKGFRMVGATPAYLGLYKAEFKNGDVFSKPFETVAGTHTGLAVGDEIAVTHGFAATSDDVHDAHLYKITGVLKPTGTVLDKLLVTQVESVQQLHAGHSHYDHTEEDEEKEPEEHNHHSHDDE
ncbi:MAG: ABC transporter permease, partial [Pseudomonadota bacterium]|nr:ABC transporter permease [Pseudomonadota bacterium]